MNTLYKTLVLITSAIILFECNPKTENTKNYHVKRISHPPILDGLVDSLWLHIKEENIDGDRIGQEYIMGSTDLSGNFKCLRYNDSLYFLITVNDENLQVYPDSVIKYWEQDNIEIFFSGSNKRITDHNFSDNCFTHLIFSYGKKRMKGHGFENMNVLYKQKRLDNGYRLELRLPVINKFMDKKTNKIGFNIELSDNDNTKYDEGFIIGRESSIIWSDFGIRESHVNSIYYGRLTIDK